MSWQGVILVLLAATLLAGFAWYERSRPPSQILALVAVLAALAAAGRVAFAPIPNVVPTTDIALISGFALGGPPGFAVGALAALVSNFWLGQGPWTPWQMAGWGIAGLVGAWLAAATGRKLGRLGLAVACGFAGLLFGALMDLSLMVSYGGEQSLDRFLAISARSLPFNAAHVAGNVAFALVAGPALIRMLDRYRRRFEFAWPRATGRRGRRAFAGAACLLLGLSFAAGGRPAPDASAAPQAKASGAGSAASWLRAAQNSDGGFGNERGEDSSPAMTGWAVLALEATGTSPSQVSRGGTSALDYLRRTAGEISTTGDIERTILALDAAGHNPARFQGRNLVSRLLARRNGNGSWGGQVNPTAFGILALRAVGRGSGNGRSAAWLRSIANSDGGWGFAEGASSDPDSTGAVLQALGGTGGSSAAVRGGVRYLRTVQRSGGGFALYGGPVNAQSTAWAVQGLIAAGENPGSFRRGGRSPIDYLESVQAGDGHYRYSSSSDQTPVWVTAQALLAASRSTFPLPRVGGATSGGGGGGSAGSAFSGSAGASSGAGGSVPSSTGGGGDGEGPGAPAAGGVEGAQAGGSEAVPGEVAAAPAAARFETDDDGSDTPLLIAIAAGVLLIAVLTAVLQRRSAGL